MKRLAPLSMAALMALMFPVPSTGRPSENPPPRKLTAAAVCPIPSSALFTAVEGKGTLIRYISLPIMSVKDLKNSFSIEAEKYFPFSQDQIYTDCYVFDGGKEGDTEMNVMAAASKKELVDERMTLLKDLNLTCDFIGVAPIAVANAVNVLGTGQEIPEDKGVAVLDIGDSVSSLTIMINGSPKFSRDGPFPHRG